MAKTSPIEQAGLTALRRGMRAEGGWGYHSAGQLFVEPTALGLLALAPRGSEVEHPQWPAAELENSLGALIACRHADGSFGVAAGDPDPSWATSVAILALVAHGRGEQARASGAWLADWRAPAQDLLTAEFVERTRKWMHVDQRIPGWPWAGDTFATVEPTAMAAIALRACGDLAPERIRDALRYLEDRVCRGGGWNYGNPYFLEAALPPITLPSAKALLALLLCGRKPSDRLVVQSFGALAELLRDNPSRKAHGWGALAFAAAGDRDRAREHALAAVDSGDGRGPWGGEPDASAVALLAFRAAGEALPSCLTPRRRGAAPS